MQNQTIIQHLIQRLNKYPSIQYQKITEQELIVFKDTPNGFDITLYTDQRENTLYLGSFHTHFENTEDETEYLRQIFFYALSGDIRIQEQTKAGANAPYKSILQFQDQQGQWINNEVIGALFFKFWRKTTTSYRQNSYPIEEIDKA